MFRRNVGAIGGVRGIMGSVAQEVTQMTSVIWYSFFLSPESGNLLFRRDGETYRDRVP